MLRIILNVLVKAVGFVLAAFIVLLCLLCALTPEKTKYGMYTNAYKYWTSDVYLCENFSCPVKKGK